MTRQPGKGSEETSTGSAFFLCRTDPERRPRAPRRRPKIGPVEGIPVTLSPRREIQCLQKHKLSDKREQFQMFSPLEE